MPLRFDEDCNFVKVPSWDMQAPEPDRQWGSAHERLRTPAELKDVVRKASAIASKQGSLASSSQAGSLPAGGHTALR